MTSKTLAMLCGFSLVLGLAFVSDAHADTIAFGFGTLSIDGEWSSNTHSIDDATIARITLNQAQVSSATGGFATYFSAGDLVTYNDISLVGFQPFTLWSGGGLDFVLTSLTVVRQDKNQLRLEGVGTLYGNGIVQNGVAWEFRGTKNGNFQNSETVPEPSTLILLAVGLIVFGLASRKLSGRARAQERL